MSAKLNIGISDDELAGIIVQRAKRLQCVADQFRYYPENVTGLLTALEIAVKEFRKRSDTHEKTVQKSNRIRN